MKDRQKIFLDKVTKLIVDDTRIDYDMGRIYFPVIPTIHSSISSFPTSLSYFYLLITSFSKHCKERYGLTDEEIRYVWDQYKDILKDKIKNNER